ncbi:helicase C-terminal domain-containing protein, partial [Phlyctochytrium arcticum]
AIVSTHSVSVDLKQISQSIFQLTSYLDRYRRRLRGRNVIYISQLRDILHSLERVLSGSERAKDASTTNAKAAVVTVNDFVHNLGIDNINLYKVEKYLQESKLAQKLQGFVEKNAQTKKKADQSTDEQEFTPKHVSAIRFVESFVMSMTNADLEGRVMVDYAGKTLKYLLLNPSNCFRPIIEEARAVVLAGGTMEPVSELVDELFSYIPPTRLARFSCGHIIPPSSLLCLTVSKGPRSEPFSFTYENRGSSSMLNDLGAAIINLCNVTPGGVICFLSSYDILDQIVDGWGTSGVLTRISAKKQVFKEPRTSEMVDEVLQGYAQSIKMTEEHRVGQTGAILFAVVGGKMSEGINFSDNMGRLVIMVGLPFPNLFAADLQEKLRYIKTRAAATGKSNKEIEECASGYYENTCMKAVNQSIGRVIRHKDDYAAIVLLDHRYAQPRIKNKLPGWIRDAGIEDCTEFGKVVGKVAVFFRAKRVLKG